MMETTIAILWLHPPAWIWREMPPPPKKKNSIWPTCSTTRFVSPHSWGDYSLWRKWREILCPNTFLGILPVSHNSFHTCVPFTNSHQCYQRLMIAVDISVTNHAVFFISRRNGTNTYLLGRKPWCGSQLLRSIQCATVLMILFTYPSSLFLNHTLAKSIEGSGSLMILCWAHRAFPKTFVCNQLLGPTTYCHLLLRNQSQLHVLY